MKTFTLVNLITEQLVTVQANSRLHARTKACQIARHAEDDRCYWIVKQSYHKTEGFEVLSA